MSTFFGNHLAKCFEVISTTARYPSHDRSNKRPKYIKCSFDCNFHAPKS